MTDDGWFLKIILKCVDSAKGVKRKCGEPTVSEPTAPLRMNN